MATEIQLHHIGEVVLAGLLRELHKRGDLDAESSLHTDCRLAAVVGQAKIGQPLFFDPNVQLEAIEINHEKLLFDGVHGADVLCRGPGSLGLALEAKLGLDRMARGEFRKRFLAPASLTSHTSRRFKGSMVAILNYRALQTGELLPLRPAAPNSVDLVPDWFLVIRREVWNERWKKGKACPPLAPNAHVTIFEDIVRRHGDAKRSPAPRGDVAGE